MDANMVENVDLFSDNAQTDAESFRRLFPDADTARFSGEYPGRRR
jgi:hypothetical protein